MASGRGAERLTFDHPRTLDGGTAELVPATGRRVPVMS
jgi:hypothetical protein